MHAKDDPIVRSNVIPFSYFKSLINENIIFAETDKGGHIAWHEGINERWYPKPAMEFLELSKVIKPDKKSKEEEEPAKTKIPM